MSTPQPLLEIQSLEVVLPNGQVLLRDLSLTLHPGEVAVLLGGSGAGKSTLARVLFEPKELERAGFSVESKTVAYDRNTLGLVPQRGALFDHLDVRGNIELAQRYRGEARGEHDVETWLTRVGLSPDLSAASVGKLSGGQAQRVSVARALASERRLLLLDEPSVGLDPHRVRMLAKLIREQVESLGLAVIVVTHDPALAAGVADKLLLLDPETRNLRHLFADEWPGPMEDESIDEATRGRWLLAVESEVVQAIENTSPDARGKGENSRSAIGRMARQTLRKWTSPFAAAGHSMAAAPSQFFRQPRDFLSIMSRVLLQTTLRPALFYAIVSVLIGYTLLFVISKVGGAGVRTDALLRQIGGSYAIALAPPLSAILFVAASGSATNAWLGSMGLTRQTAALEALGISKAHYLWAPTWLALALSFFAVALLVTAGMLFGGWLLCQQHELPGAWDLLVADLFDPRPERSPYVGRGLFLVWVYGWGIASNVIAQGGSPKSDADDVTQAMTGSVVSCTLWVVAWELVTVLWVFRG